MTTIAGQRRRLALSRFWAQFRHDRAGMTGLIILGIFILTAILAPILISPDALDVTQA